MVRVPGPWALGSVCLYFLSFGVIAMHCCVWLVLHGCWGFGFSYLRLHNRHLSVSDWTTFPAPKPQTSNLLVAERVQAFCHGSNKAQENQFGSARTSKALTYMTFSNLSLVILNHSTKSDGCNYLKSNSNDWGWLSSFKIFIGLLTMANYSFAIFFLIVCLVQLPIKSKIHRIY